MDIKNVILLCIKFVFVSGATYQKPAHHSLWPERCTKNSAVLNDCNWCYCDENHLYACKARVCGGVDMFGHFNDAIQDLHVGMEGHGVWRTTQTPCEPKNQYEKDGLVCICTEDGTWPNPVCRDAFRVLHSVAVTESKHPTKGTSCNATELYLYGCNVCFCPSSGKIDPVLCTTRNCTENDPVLYENRVKAVRIGTENEGQALEVYAECELHRKYKFGCQTCICLRNNRLLCDACNKTEEVKSGGSSYCDGHEPGQSFTVGCNICVCDTKGLIYCTTRLCVDSKTAQRTIPLILEESMKEVEKPYDKSNCVAGTKYKSGCNNCFCIGDVDGRNTYSCSLKYCFNDSDSIGAIQSDCVEGTTYETTCQICRCHMLNGVKMESCYVNNECTGVKATKVNRATDVSSLHGYCEPYHTYNRDCNTCRCLPDGKTLMCTSTICKKKATQPIIVDIVPINQRNGSPCPRDHMYRVECNICFCLSNGNVLCSTADCSSSKKHH